VSNLTILKDSIVPKGFSRVVAGPVRRRGDRGKMQCATQIGGRYKNH